MTEAALAYAAITPVRDEAANLPRLAEALAAQVVRPATWLIVDTGSSDDTVRLARELAASHPWVRVLESPADAAAARGAPIVRAFHAGLDALGSRPDVVVKLDADVSMEADFFQRILLAFAEDGELGICGGVCLEERDGVWAEPPVRAGHVRGAVRAYRAACLADVLPLEERVGWDGLDALKAQTRGWRVRVVADAAFRHHRPLGARDARPWRAQVARGEAAHYMGYRPGYLLLRSLYRGLSDPRALGMAVGYLRQSVARAPRCADEAVLDAVRRSQSLRALMGVAARRG